VFDAKELIQLMLHYNDGKDIPLDVELKCVMLSPMLERYVGFECSAEDWPSGQVMQGGIVSPLQIRYDGNRILALNRGEETVWKEANNELQ